MSERVARADVTIGRAAGIGFFHSIAGHFWTAAPQLLDFVRRSPQAGRPLLLPIEDPGVGRITLRAVHHEIESADSVVIIVHGIGGTADSGYCQAAASAASAAKYSAVRMSLRGADGTGDDIYHACLTDDLQAVLKSPQLRRYRRVYLLGYSQGGLMVLHAAAARIDRRLAGVAAICPPLDLRSAMENFDRKRFFLHKRLMNARANRFYAAVERTGRAHCTLAQLQRAHSCAAWNQLTIVPRLLQLGVDDGPVVPVASAGTPGVFAPRSDPSARAHRAPAPQSAVKH
jgi:uncharacterized protein